MLRVIRECSALCFWYIGFFLVGITSLSGFFRIMYDSWDFVMNFNPVYIILLLCASLCFLSSNIVAQKQISIFYITISCIQLIATLGTLVVSMHLHFHK